MIELLNQNGELIPYTDVEITKSTTEKISNLFNIIDFDELKDLFC